LCRPLAGIDDGRAQSFLIGRPHRGLRLFSASTSYAMTPVNVGPPDMRDTRAVQLTQLMGSFGLIAVRASSDSIRGAVWGARHSAG